MKIIFLDPYGRYGAHPALNKLVIGDVAGSFEYKYIKGLFDDSGHYGLYVNCIVLMIVGVAVRFLGYKEVHLLAWPNRLLFLFNCVAGIIGPTNLYLYVHNNIERATKRQSIIKFNGRIVIFDSGLMGFALSAIKCLSYSVFAHPIPEIKRGGILSKRNIADSPLLAVNRKFNLLLYGFGELDYDYLVDFLPNINRGECRLYYRGENSIKMVNSMPHFNSIDDYYSFIKEVDFVIALPCLKYRLTASGFLSDCLGAGAVLWLPSDFPLNFDYVPESLKSACIFSFNRNADFPWNATEFANEK